MSRLVKLDGPGKQRNHLMRTAAELIRLLGQKASMDEDTRDMVAMLIYCLRGIANGIDDSAQAWEKRDYWVKAEQFRVRWAWAGRAADQLTVLTLNQTWEQLPTLLISLLPHFTEIKIGKLTRNPEMWQGAYQRLMEQS